MQVQGISEKSIVIHEYLLDVLLVLLSDLFRKNAFFSYFERFKRFSVKLKSYQIDF